MKKLMLFSLLASSMAFNVSCDSGDLLAGAVGVGVGVGIGRHYEHQRNHRHGRNRWIMDEQTQASADVNASSSTQQFAAKHNLPLTAARKVEAAFNGLDSNGLASLQQVGLTEQDARVIASRQMPAASSVHNVAGALGITDKHAQTLLSEMNQDFTAEASDVNSNYWQACMENGSWRTPENNYCQATFWNGCSPSTGASACY